MPRWPMFLAEWREYRRITKGTYYNMRKEKRTPDVLDPGIGRLTITQRADAKWDKDRHRWAKQDEGRKREERRSAQASMAGKIAAKSPRHVSNRKKLR
jgi:hypothetical protein